MPVNNTFFGAGRSAALLAKAERIALLGAGGVGMYSVARELLARGKTIIGSDRVESPLLEDLRRRGARFLVGECPPGVEACDLLVYTTAVPDAHPALTLTEQAGIPRMSRADALAGLSWGRAPGIAVAGMHGKSTVTAMLGHILEGAGRDPAVACGAVMLPEGTPYRAGSGGFVYEACEYQRAFLCFSPDVAVVLNIDDDHTDCYPTLDCAEEAFASFLSHSRTAVVSADDARAVRAASACPGDVFTFSLSDRQADGYAEDIAFEHGRYAFTLVWKGERAGRIRVGTVGRYNIANALAAATAALSLGVPTAAACTSLSGVQGVKRRMEYRGSYQKTAFYDDYAHHPAEISASLSAARELSPGRLICVFQSHTYTRTAAHLAQIAEALDAADLVLVADIYPARETDPLGMSADLLARRIGEKATAPGDMEALRQTMLSLLHPGDTVVVMGAGDIDRLFEGLPLLLQT